MLWKIEVFHKILKSGCRTEDAKLRTADCLANLVALFCIVSWRVLWMTFQVYGVVRSGASCCAMASSWHVARSRG